ncbi:cysteine desulfurase [Bacillus coahuilensis p1.1.43]|uniref:cysteine desulfurase n=1 Tax=Bacillus coahuilensis p1.1.43 TaxID=1150625 RepID=A0A147K747_9BACI|nr:cysteine desulfurase family protein [Bacillus coahuilensis]KUP05821.1 cysteine desulfurase [Bacillus coahuilensis p1.1.43]
MEKIYLDHAATSPTHPVVADVMLPIMTKVFGNPSSIHGFGREARMHVDQARTTISKAIGAKFHDIIFTSGGTEADNLAIIGVAKARQHQGKHIITTEIEHHAVLHTCQMLEGEGFEVTYLPVDEKGLISIEGLKDALREDTILVTIMYGNNEVGTIQPIGEIGELLQEHPAYFHTDAVQAFGILPIDVNELNVDLLSVSAHKINGPKGMGFLYAREEVQFVPSLYGGEQERKRRAGTENVPGVVGLSKAVELGEESRAGKQELYLSYKRIFCRILQENGVRFDLNGFLEESLPHVLNLSFPGTDVEAMLVNLDMSGIAASSGSACTAGSIEPSHVLVAMHGKESERLRNSIRFSFGYNNTVEQVEKAAKAVATIVQRLTTSTE